MNRKKKEKSSQRKTFFLSNNGSREIYEKSEGKYVRFWNICLHIRLTVFLLAKRFPCFSPWSPWDTFPSPFFADIQIFFSFNIFPFNRRWMWKENFLIFSASLAETRSCKSFDKWNLFGKFKKNRYRFYWRLNFSHWWNIDWWIKFEYQCGCRKNDIQG